MLVHRCTNGCDCHHHEVHGIQVTPTFDLHREIDGGGGGGVRGQSIACG
jgi:hypothetical protein